MLKTMTRAEAAAAIEDAKRDPLTMAAKTDKTHLASSNFFSCSGVKSSAMGAPFPGTREQERHYAKCVARMYGGRRRAKAIISRAVMTLKQNG